MCLMGNEHQRVMVPFLEACSPTYQQIPQKFSKFSTGKLWLTSGFRLGVSEFQTTPEENEGNWLPSAIHQLPFVWFSKCCHSFCFALRHMSGQLDGAWRHEALTQSVFHFFQPGLSTSSVLAQRVCRQGRPAHCRPWSQRSLGFQDYINWVGSCTEDVLNNLNVSGNAFKIFYIKAEPFRCVRSCFYFTWKALLRSNKVRQRLQDLRSALPSAVPQRLGPRVLEKIAATRSSQDADHPGTTWIENCNFNSSSEVPRW